MAERRTNFGAGLAELHEQLADGGKVDEATQTAVGVWSQNRVEWQITGMCPFLCALGAVLGCERSGCERLANVISTLDLTCCS